MFTALEGTRAPTRRARTFRLADGCTPGCFSSRSDGSPSPKRHVALRPPCVLCSRRTWRGQLLSLAPPESPLPELRAVLSTSSSRSGQRGMQRCARTRAAHLLTLPAFVRRLPVKFFFFNVSFVFATSNHHLGFFHAD